MILETWKKISKVPVQGFKVKSKKAMYGYEIIKVVNQETNNAFEWKEGTLYPCLHRLESNGLIISEWITESTVSVRQ